MLPTAILARVERFALRRYVVVFGVAAVVIAVSAGLGSRLKLETDILSMVPENNRTIEIFKRSLRDFGSLDYFLILLSAPDDGDAAEGGTSAGDYEEFADAFAARIAELETIEYVEHRLDETSAVFANLAENALVFLGPERIDEVRPLFEDDAIRRRIEDLRERLESQPTFLVKLQATLDPLGLLPVLYESFLRSRGSFRIDLMDGYYLSADRKSLLIIAKPKRPPQDLAFSHEVHAQIEAARKGAEAAVRSELEPGEPNPLAGMSVEYGGGYMIAIDDSDLIKGDIWWNALISFGLVIGLYLFCYRRLAALAYSSIPLAAGQAMTFALAWICLPGLNSATSGFTAMLMGLGTDFTIVMYGRYIEERRMGRSLEQAVGSIMGETAIGVFTGVITSAGTFYAMCVTQFPGLRHFGFLVGSGILLCGLAILFLVPAMIAYVEGVKVGRIASLLAFVAFPPFPLPVLRWLEMRRSKRTGRPHALYLHSFGVENLLKVSNRWPRTTAVVSLAACLGLGLFAFDIEFSENIKDLRSASNRGVLVQEKISERFGGSLNYMIVMCHGATLDEALESNRDVAKRLERFVESGEIHGYESLLSYLPAREAQEAVLDELRPGSPTSFDMERIEGTFRAALAENGFRAGAYDEYLARLRRTLQPERVLTLEDLEERRLGDLVGRYHRVVAGDHVTATYIFPDADRVGAARQKEIARELEQAGRGVEVTSVNLVGLELRSLFRRDAAAAVLLGLVLVAILLYADFRRLSLVFFAMLQLGAGVLAMLGSMSLLGIPMNFVNAFATTMILGVGVDYGIHIIHRLSRADRPGDEGVLQTGKAVVMAALTNIAGFGTVAFSNYPGLRSVGLVCVLGTIGCLFTALTLLPSLMAVFPASPARRKA